MFVPLGGSYEVSEPYGPYREKSGELYSAARADSFPIPDRLRAVVIICPPGAADRGLRILPQGWIRQQTGRIFPLSPRLARRHFIPHSLD